MIWRHSFLWSLNETTRVNEAPILETVRWPDEAATQAFAEQLARALQAQGLDGCITLEGDLGAGKTTLVRHLLRALGVRERIKSPTYAVVEPYAVPTGRIWHFDFYRFSDPHEWEDAGFRDLFASPGLKLCEWPNQAQGLLPQVDLAIHIEVDADEQRHVRLQVHSARARRWLAA